MEQTRRPVPASEPHSLREAAGDLAFTDKLTGLHNYRLLSSLFDCWWTDLVHDYDQLSLIIIDLDRFKR
jgi:PleD family two-component response regulator